MSLPASSRTRPRAPRGSPPRHLEFLVPLFGDDDGRPARPEHGIVAERLKYLDLLAFEPLALDASNVEGIGIDEPLHLLLPDPLGYILHKVLIRQERLRRPEKARKDLAYIYDVILLSKPMWEEMPARLDRMRAGSETWSRWIDRALTSLADL